MLTILGAIFLRPGRRGTKSGVPSAKERVSNLSCVVASTMTLGTVGVSLCTTDLCVCMGIGSVWVYDEYCCLFGQVKIDVDIQLTGLPPPRFRLNGRPRTRGATRWSWHRVTERLIVCS